MHFHPKNVQKFAVFHFAPPSTKSFLVSREKIFPALGKIFPRQRKNNLGVNRKQNLGMR